MKRGEIKRLTMELAANGKGSRSIAGEIGARVSYVQGVLRDNGIKDVEARKQKLQYENGTPLCRKCGSPIPKLCASRLAKGDFLCEECARKKSAVRLADNRESINAYHRDYAARPENKAKSKARQENYRVGNREKYQATSNRYALRRKYGMSESDFDEMLAAQDGKCSICGTDTPTGVGRFHVDHCHETGGIRGLGMMHDDPERLERAAEYLRRYENAHHRGEVDRRIPSKARVRRHSASGNDSQHSDAASDVSVRALSNTHPAIHD